MRLVASLLKHTGLILLTATITIIVGVIFILPTSLICSWILIALGIFNVEVSQVLAIAITCLFGGYVSKIFLPGIGLISRIIAGIVISIVYYYFTRYQLLVEDTYIFIAASLIPPALVLGGLFLKEKESVRSYSKTT